MVIFGVGAEDKYNCTFNIYGANDTEHSFNCDQAVHRYVDEAPYIENLSLRQDEAVRLLKIITGRDFNVNGLEFRELDTADKVVGTTAVIGEVFGLFAGAAISGGLVGAYAGSQLLAPLGNKLLSELGSRRSLFVTQHLGNDMALFMSVSRQ